MHALMCQLSLSHQMQMPSSWLLAPPVVVVVTSTNPREELTCNWGCRYAMLVDRPKFPFAAPGGLPRPSPSSCAQTERRCMRVGRKNEHHPAPAVPALREAQPQDVASFEAEATLSWSLLKNMDDRHARCRRHSQRCALMRTAEASRACGGRGDGAVQRRERLGGGVGRARSEPEAVLCQGVAEAAVSASASPQRRALDASRHPCRL